MYKKTANEIMGIDPDLAIIPVGSLEQHGPHLPVMTDWAIAMEMGKRVAEQMNAFLLPAIPVSTCREHMGKKGTVWMHPTTFYQMMTDIVMSLKEQGFKKIGIVQCHGGIFVMSPLVRNLNATLNPELMVAVVDTCDLNGVLFEEGLVESTSELHAGECETSQMLAIAPQYVHMDLAEDSVPTVPRSYLNYGSIFRASASGVWGEPTLSSAQKGEKILERSAQLVVEELNKAFTYMENKERFYYSNF